MAKKWSNWQISGVPPKSWHFRAKVPFLAKTGNFGRCQNPRRENDGFFPDFSKKTRFLRFWPLSGSYSASTGHFDHFLTNKNPDLFVGAKILDVKMTAFFPIFPKKPIFPVFGTFRFLHSSKRGQKPGFWTFFGVLTTFWPLFDPLFDPYYPNMPILDA